MGVGAVHHGHRRGRASPVLGPMVFGCLFCARSYQKTLASLNFADSKTLNEDKREELLENLKSAGSIGWDVNVIDPRELSAKMLKKKNVKPEKIMAVNELSPYLFRLNLQQTKLQELVARENTCNFDAST